MGQTKVEEAKKQYKIISKISKKRADRLFEHYEKLDKATYR